MSRRTDKVNELLRREIGTTIQRDFEFPGTIVTVIEVEVTDDLKEARVWVGVVGRMAPSQVLEKLNSRPWPKESFCATLRASPSGWTTPRSAELIWSTCWTTLTKICLKPLPQIRRKNRPESCGPPGITLRILEIRDSPTR